MEKGIKLIIFDYSGTLSPAMAEFAKTDNLLRQLQMSGLAAAGIDSADKFWQIVNDTWQEGSTTRLGYKKVMLAHLLKLFPELARSRQQEAAKAMSDFVDAYLDHSPIDEHWRPVLEMLNSHKSVQVIIATDHYAEATATIIEYLRVWNIEADSVREKGAGNFVVANSADIGTYKESPRFWKTVLNALQNTYDRILLIDDFGANEQGTDAYAQADKISKRRKKTINILENIFLTQVKCFPFVAVDKKEELIAETVAAINRFLSNKNKP